MVYIMRISCCNVRVGVLRPSRCRSIGTELAINEASRQQVAWLPDAGEFVAQNMSGSHGKSAIVADLPVIFHGYIQDSQRVRDPFFSPGSVIAEELLNHREKHLAGKSGNPGTKCRFFHGQIIYKWHTLRCYV